MAKKLSTRDFRKVYLSGVKHDVKRKSFQTIIVGLVAFLSVFLKDMAANQSLDSGKMEEE